MNKKEYVLPLMSEFFKDKSFYCGGPIPNLFCDKNVNLVATMDFLDGFDLIYRDLSEYYCCNEKGVIDWQVKLVLDTIKLPEMRPIPKEHKAGIIILYIKYVKGLVKLWTT